MERTAVVHRPTTCLLPTGHAGSLPADTYRVVDIDGAAERGELFLLVDEHLVAVSVTSDDYRIADDTRPFEGMDGHRVGTVVGTCGHAVTGSEWLAGMHTCERCAL